MLVPPFGNVTVVNGGDADDPTDDDGPFAPLVGAGMANPQSKASSMASLSKSPPFERMHVPQEVRRFPASSDPQTQLR